MHLQLCNLGQTRLKVFRYCRLVPDETLVRWGGNARIAGVSLAAADEACGRCCRWRWEREGFEVIAVGRNGRAQLRRGRTS
jgi:hypothetical protein